MPEWPLLETAEKYHIPPWELVKAPALWVERMMLKTSITQQAERDRAANEG